MNNVNQFWGIFGKWFGGKRGMGIIGGNAGLFMIKNMKTSFVNLHSGQISLQSVGEADRNDWESCWNKYTEGEVDSVVTNATWERLNNLSIPFPVYGLIAKTEGFVLGILHARLEHGTFSEKPRLYVEDLFVDFRVQRGILLKSGDSDLPDIVALFKFAVIKLIGDLNLDVSGIRFDTEESNMIARRTYEKRLSAGEGKLNQRRDYIIDKGRIQDEIGRLDDMISDGKISIIPHL